MYYDKYNAHLKGLDEPLHENVYVRQVIFEKFEPHKLIIKFVSTTIVANTKKLKVRWSPEMAAEISSYHSLNVESELLALNEFNISDNEYEILNSIINGTT